MLVRPIKPDPGLGEFQTSIRLDPDFAIACAAFLIPHALGRFALKVRFRGVVGALCAAAQ
jgi:hypothetical protein